MDVKFFGQEKHIYLKVTEKKADGQRKSLIVSL
jgi:hypothetical protein